jgi:hypothetical protein
MKLTQAACATFLIALTGCPGMGALLRQYGYTELRPPSQLMAPGTMVWVQDTKPFQAGVICTQAMSLGANFKPMQQPTASDQLNKAADTKFDIGAEYMSMVKANGSFELIENIQVELHDPVIYTVNDVDIVNSIGQRDPVCAQAISNRAKAGYVVTMISSALMADVTYHVVWKTNANVDVQVKIAALYGLAPHLGVTEASATDTTITGKHMFWGVKDDLYLAQLSANGSGTGGPASGTSGPMPPRTEGEPERAIPTEAEVAVDATVDADAMKQTQAQDAGDSAL